MHPERIALVAVLLFIASFVCSRMQRRASPIGLAGVVWAAFAMWEWYCSSQAYNIRVDLFVVIPVIYVFTAGGLFSIFWNPKKPNPPSTV